MKYFLIAGEASGDLHGGYLMRALRRQDAAAEFCFLGGDMMADAAGCAPVVHYKRMAYMGFSEVLRHLSEIMGNMKTARHAVADFRPDALILIDYPSFNLKIAKFAWSRGIPVYYYISPKVWAWKPWRMRRIRKYVEHVYSILPFEVDYYRRHRNESITYVGNPTVGEVRDALRNVSPEWPERPGLPSDKKIVALLPGSRLGEIRNNLPVMLEAVKRFPDCCAVIAGAPGVEREFYDQFTTDGRLVFGETYELLAHARAALVTSGTATLETAVAGTPQVVCYRANGSRLAYKLFEHILNVRFVSLPNLIADRRVVAEMLLHQCTPEAVAAQLAPLLDAESSESREMTAGYRLIAERLGDGDCSETTARCIVERLKSTVRH